jgi:hypothetical protein
MATNQPISIANATDIRDIAPPIDIPSGLTWLWWTLAVLVVIGLAIFTWLWLKRRKIIAKFVVEIPAHERARRQLEAALGLYDQPKPFCIVVSDAVRLYLEERFGLRAPERTTDEFLGDLSRSSALTDLQKESLQQFLSACDMVKFARYEPQRPELEALYNSALRLIEETEPARPPTNPNGQPAILSVEAAVARSRASAK